MINSRSAFQKKYDNLENIQKFRTPKAKDLVQVYHFEDGGLISFMHDDGFIIHTLNTAEGFSRKLKQLEISIS
ncbi:MAG: hypothetical protein JEY91_16280 [Spirochaetaceae bacterium]|nr:hypothetical protein [Spirochaetaceae bacterium]